ncbi:XrtA system polysaccharide chain length determinant [Sphaerotilus sp.]|uniref:XrtA system polysaccharide chain length determinant n=1 Tax=Sphaerotilus sp. TaxID=2093942 RepID=UPI002ACE74CD|nr:XrtA system polysaccharide chain length determinant [Sphaerotilus sp.]MDZ7857478.1 XrtA system polysaccharide chain length determinant [Sphaerotilus sp.]
MNEFTRQAAILAGSVWQHRWMAVAVAWVVALAGALVVWVVPERHEARARVYVDTQTVLRPMMVGLAFQPDIDQQVRMLGRTLISRPNVERLVNNPAIGLEKMAPGQLDAQIESLMKSIKVELTGGNNLYAISYRDKDPVRARKLVEVLVGMFMESGLDSKRKDSAEASRFIDEQIQLYEGKLTEAENRLKDFKLKNMSVAATTNQDFFGRIQTLTDDVNRLRVALGAAEQSRDATRRELANEEPNLPVAAASAVSLTPDLDSRIEAQKRQLDEMLRRYTEEHPDVLTTRRIISQLEDQRRRELDALKSSNSAVRRAAAATNPVFQRLRLNLADAEANVASLRSQLGMQQARLEEIRAQSNKVPQAEAELVQLNRDYEIMRRNYDQLVQRREAASLGVKIDQTSSMADFRLIEPPRVLPTPVFPSRIQLALGVMLLAVASGIAVAYAQTLLNPVFSSERELREFTKRPVLGSLLKVEDPRDRDLERQDRLKLAGVMGLFVLANVGWVAWITMRSAS